MFTVFTARTLRREGPEFGGHPDTHTRLVEELCDQISELHRHYIQRPSIRPSLASGGLQGGSMKRAASVSV